MAKKQKFGGSLQDQLRQAGLVTEKQLKKAKKNLHRQEIRVKQGGEVDASKADAARVLAEKQAKDREHNRQRQAAADLKALDAQIRQLIEMNRQRQTGDVAYNFTDGKKIKKIHISQLNKDQINRGQLAIVRFGDGYELVPEGVARKIIARIPERHEDVVLYLFERSNNEVDEDDPYKDFPIPDDLEW